MENMKVYNAGRAVPDEAKKTIGAGRLKGFTDINPMWRIKKLTEIFGPCGVGWWYEITNERFEHGHENEICCFVDILLYYKTETGETSKGIPGTGGSSFTTKETKGVYTSDECLKMALTDALSVAAKALGIGADVYFEKDGSKYFCGEQAENAESSNIAENAFSNHHDKNTNTDRTDNMPFVCSECSSQVSKQVRDYSVKHFGRSLCFDCQKKVKK